MPIYEYECIECKHKFEKLVFKSDDDKIECPACNAENTRKMVSSVSIGNSVSDSGCGPGTSGGFS